ncbi:MAG: hypothetical protein V5A14_01045 [Desulfohalobiaceae bacterium]
METIEGSGSHLFRECLHIGGISLRGKGGIHTFSEEDPKGDRVRVTMSGKFLPYSKWYPELLGGRFLKH